MDQDTVQVASEAAAEIELLREVMTIASVYPRRLYRWEIDQILGVAPAPGWATQAKLSA